jgi:hypothetical protein
MSAVWARVIATARKVGDALEGKDTGANHILLQHERAVAQPALTTIYAPSVFMTTPPPAPSSSPTHALIEELKDASDVPLVVLYPRSLRRLGVAASILVGLLFVIWLAAWLFRETQE